TAELGTAGCDSGGCFLMGASSFEDGAHPLGTWRQVPATYDNSSKTFRVFLDGVEDGRAIAQTVANLQLTPGESVLLGARKAGGGPPLVGGLDEVQIFNRALRALEI